MVGGGLAGISAALELADRGHEVTLVERSRNLGGLCRSVPDQVAGRVDTGQHVFLGCCTALEDLLRRIQAPPAARQERLELVVVARSGRWRRLRSAPLPGALHLLPVLLGWPGLPSRSLPAAARVTGALRSAGNHPTLLDSTPARSWLESLGQDPDLIEAVWEPFLVSACNVRLENCSAALAAFVIGQGMLAGPAAAAMRIPATDLTAWLDPPARRELERVGVRVELGWRATGLVQGRSGRHRLQGAAGQELGAEWVVLATPARAAERLLGDRTPPQLRAAANLPASPIVNIHLFTDRPFLPGPVVAVPRSPLQWIFDRSALGDPQQELAGDPVFHSAVSVSAADTEVTVPEATLLEQTWALCQRLFPAAFRARLRHGRVTREAQATFAALPGSAAARPGPASGVAGVVFAGNWTATGWPATMEGAVRSGAAAVRELLTA